MARTFKDTLDSDAGAFTSTSHFGESIVHYKVPGGSPETINAIVDRDVLDPAVGRFGVASVITDDAGVNIKSRAILEISSDVDVTEERPGGRYPSTFEIDGVTWIAKRVTGRDSAMQSVEISRIDQKATRKP